MDFAPAQSITDDLDQLLGVLPPHICDPLEGLENRRELLEVIMDLGREPEARLPGQEVLLSTHPVTEEDIDYVVQRIGAFGDGNGGLGLHRRPPSRCWRELRQGRSEGQRRYLQGGAFST